MILGGLHQIWQIDITPQTSSMYVFAGNAIAGFVDGDATAARFRFPTTIVETKDLKSVFIVDGFNKFIRKIDMTSFPKTVSTFAGSNIQNSKDGIGTTSSFGFIHSICITSNDLEILVLDNRIIRRIVIATAQVSTIATDIKGAGILDSVVVQFVFDTSFQTFSLNTDDTILYVIEPNFLKSIDLVNNIVKTIPFEISANVWNSVVTANNSNLIYMDVQGFPQNIRLNSIQLKNNLGCKACPSNSESAEERSSCFCNAGFSGLHTGTCTKCKSGNISQVRKTSTDCSCNIGFFMADGDICTQCSAGKFKSDANSANCQDCIVNSNSPEGSESSSACQCDTGFSRRNANECIQNINTAQKKYSLLINMVIGGSTLDISTEIIDAIQDQSSISFFIPIYRISRFELNANKGSTRRLLSVVGSFSIFSPSPQENSEIKSIVTVETLNSILSIASSNVISVLSASVEEVVIQEFSPIAKPTPDDFFDIGIILLVCFLVFFVFLCCFYFISSGKLFPKTKSSNYLIFCEECHYRI